MRSWYTAMLRHAVTCGCSCNLAYLVVPMLACARQAQLLHSNAVACCRMQMHRRPGTSYSAYPVLPVSAHSAPNGRNSPNGRRSPPNGRRQYTHFVREWMGSAPNEPDSRRMNVVLLSESGSFGEPTFQRSRFIRLPNVAEWTYSPPDERILGRMNVFSAEWT